MPISNFPKGFSGGVSIRGLPLFPAFATSQSANTGTSKTGVFWVDSNYGADGNDGSYNKPLATLARAFALANAFDIVLLKPGHAETITAATTTMFNVANVQVIGIGQGASRPTFTFTTATTAAITVSAAGNSVSNVLFVANFGAIVKCFSVTTAKDFIVDGCEFRDTDSTHNFVAIVSTSSTDNAADGLVFTNNKVRGTGTTAATTPIKLGGATDRVTISDNYINLAILNNTSAVLAHTTKVVTNLEMARNRVFRPNTDTATGGALITTSATTNNGLVYDNYVQHADVAAAILVTAGSIYGMFNNLADGDADASGFVLPAIGAD